MSSLLRLVVLAVIATASSVAIAKRLETQAAPRIASDELMEVVRTLASPAYQGRRTGTEGNKRARAYLLDQFAKTKLRPIGAGYAFPFRVTRSSKSGADGERAELDGVNLVGVCHGTGAADNGAMVISAHYDHVGVRAGAVYPGADDNASGVATLLALARYCTSAPWTHDAVFAAFDAEESGLQGARAFVSEPPISRARLALNVNLDMVSRSASRELFAAGTHHYPAVRPPLEAVARRTPIALRFGHDKPRAIAGGQSDWTRQSDHAAFHAAGIPFVYFGVEDHADYHKPTDTPDKIDPEFFRLAAETILDAVMALDRALPLSRP